MFGDDPAKDSSTSSATAGDQFENLALAYMQTAVVVCDAGLGVRFMNAAAEQLLRARSVQSLKRNLAQLMPENTEMIELLERALSTMQPISQREIVLHRPPPAHEVVVDCIATPMQSAPDTTHHLLIELSNVDRLMRLNKESQSHDVHVINRALVQGLAHEIKNPLGGLRGAAQLLERELPEPSLREYTGVIITEADRLRDLVDRMVGPGRPQTNSDVNVHQIFEHVRTLVLSEAKASLVIKRDYDPSLPTIRGDFDSLLQAVLNIVLNAAQAVEYSGTVCLRTRSDRQITISGRRRRLVIRMEITDDGPGIPDHYADQIFFPMVTHRDGGTGLGLSIAQDVVNRHEGLIEFESRVGETRFLIYLPVGEQ